MQLFVYTNFYKKKNSTLQPNPGVGHTEWQYIVNGHLKHPCSTMNPVFDLQDMSFLPEDAHPDFITYAFVPRFSRFYFVEDCVWNDGLWELHLTVDVLASFKTQLGEQSEYILRTDNDTNNFDGAITDLMYPATTNFNLERKTLANPFQTVVSEGCYVVGIISGTTASAIGAITYFALTQTQFNSLKRTLFSDDNLQTMGILDASGNLNIDDMSKELFKTMYNPYQYIVSCTWFPVAQTAMVGDPVSSIPIGWWSYSIGGKRLTQTSGTFHDGVDTIPVHPQAATRGKYLNYAPYTRVTLFGKFGTLPIDTSYVEIGNYVIGNYLVDYITGKCLYEVYLADNSAGTNRILITRTEFLIGVPVQIAQIGTDYIGATATAINSAGEVASSAFAGASVGGAFGAIDGALAGAVSAIGNTIGALMPQLRTDGTNGSFIGRELSTTLVVHHAIIVDEDIAHRGRPLCQIRKLNTLSGFVMCAEGDLNLNCYDNERNMIKQFLTTGFFWE